MIPSQASLIILAVASTLAFGAGWKLRDYQAQSDELQATRDTLSSVQKALVERDVLTVAEAMKSRTLEETLAIIRRGRQDSQIIREKEYVEKPVYAQCVVPDIGVQLLNDRIAARRSAADTGKR